MRSIPVTDRKHKRARFHVPPEIKWLMTKGLLLPDNARALGCKVMQCAECQSEVALAPTFPLIPEAEFASTKILPSLVWGKDILVLCPICSMKEVAA